jgi:branched-chain amino acid transport system substrate-binding protein
MGAWRTGIRLLLLAAVVACVALPDLGADEGDASESPYADTPAELLPFQGLGRPYKRFFTKPAEFRGPGRADPEPEGLTEARIGALVPRRGPDVRHGKSLERGITLAVEQANAAGGLRPGLPFALIVRDEAAAWGAAADAAVELVSEHGVWGLIGAFEDASSHVLGRVLLKLEVPTVNTAGSDPTLTEHAIPWLVRVRPDDRRNGYALARRVIEAGGHQRIGVLRSNDRYGRVGTAEFVDAARRLHHPITVEVRFEAGTRDFAAQVDRLRGANIDALVLWGRAAPTGRALRAVRAAGIEVPAYGPDRLVDPRFLEAAGDAAEGLVFAYPFRRDPERAAWAAFVATYRARFGEVPDDTAAYAYDGTRMLIASMRAAGLNRARIRDHLVGHGAYDGVTGAMRFDPTLNNIAEVHLGHVRRGTFHFD